MELCKSPEIFEGEMTELIFCLEFIRSYFDDCLAVLKESEENHVIQCEEVITRLAIAGLKVRVTKRYFCSLEFRISQE
jgi:hypothetical protein